MGVIESVYTYDDQLGSQWDLQILAPSSESKTTTKLKYKVQQTDVPQPSLEVERKPSGELVFKSYKESDSFSVVLRESPDFSTYKFFQAWMDIFYDRDNRVFKTFASNAEYVKNLYNVQVTFYKGTPIAIPDFTAVVSPTVYSLVNSFTGFSSATEITIPTYAFYATQCKPISIEPISLDYSGQPLLFTVNFQPERIKLFEINSGVLSAIKSFLAG